MYKKCLWAGFIRQGNVTVFLLYGVPWNGEEDQSPIPMPGFPYNIDHAWVDQGRSIR